MESKITVTMQHNGREYELVLNENNMCEGCAFFELNTCQVPCTYNDHDICQFIGSVWKEVKK